MAPQNPQQIYRQLVVMFGQQGANQLLQSLGQLNQALNQTGQQAQKTGGLISGLGKAAKGTVRGITAVGVGISSTALAMRTLGVDLISSQRQLFEFNKGLLASRVLFTRYGENITETKNRILALKDEYEFTRDELLSLQKQFQTGFTYLPVQQMTSYMRFLADAAGETSGEMAALDQVFQSISQKLPIFEQMLRGNRDMLAGQGRDILDAMFVTGQIGTGEYKQASGAIAAADVTNRARDPEQQEVRDQLEAVRRMITVGEDIQIEMAQQLQPVVNTISDVVKENRDATVKIAGYAGNIARILSIAGGFGAASGALQILRGGLGRQMMASGVGRAAAGRTAGVGQAIAGSSAGRLVGAGGRVLGGAAMSGLGAAKALGGSSIGAIAGGSAAAIGASIAAAFATAVGGFAIGTWIADEFITGVSNIKKTLDEGADSTFDLNSQKVNNLRGLVPDDQLDSIIEKQEKIRDLEKEINADVADRMSGPLSSIVNLWSDPAERSAEAMSQQNDQMNRLRREASAALVELKAQVEAEEAAMKAEQERQKEIERLRVAMQLITFEIERQDALLDAQVSAYQTLIQLQSLGGGMAINLGFGTEPEQQAALLDDLDKAIQSRQSAVAALQNLNQIISQRQADQGRDEPMPADQLANIRDRLEEAANAGAGISEEILNSLTQGLAEGISTREVMIQILQLQGEIGQKEIQRNDIVGAVTQKYEGLEQQARSAEGVLANQVQLTQNLAMGVGASAAMIFQQVQAVERVIQVLQMQRRELEGSYQAEIQQLAAAGQLEEAKRLEFQMTTKLLELDGKITSERTKQAQLSRTIRDGWVSSISAMMTGEGMFTKIVVDQNTRLGTMMSATGNQTVGLRTGFAGRGFEESQRFVPGGIVGDNSGLTEDWLQGMSASNPLAAMFMQAGKMQGLDPAKLAAAVMQWQEQIGSQLGTGAAAAGGSRYGTSELLQMQTNYFREWGSSGIKINTTTPLPVTIHNAPGMATGGVVSGPTMVQAGEGVIKNEAFVPLPDGRSIPVSMDTSGLVESATATAAETHKVKIELAQSDKRQIVEELKKELYRSFRTVAESAAHKVVDDLNMR